jgi:hypothetical protein
MTGNASENEVSSLSLLEKERKYVCGPMTDHFQEKYSPVELSVARDRESIIRKSELANPRLPYGLSKPRCPIFLRERTANPGLALEKAP